MLSRSFLMFQKNSVRVGINLCPHYFIILVTSVVYNFKVFIWNTLSISAWSLIAGLALFLPLRIMSLLRVDKITEDVSKALLSKRVDKLRLFLYVWIVHPLQMICGNNIGKFKSWISGWSWFHLWWRRWVEAVQLK